MVRIPLWSKPSCDSGAVSDPFQTALGCGQQKQPRHATYMRMSVFVIAAILYKPYEPNMARTNCLKDNNIDKFAS